MTVQTSVRNEDPITGMQSSVMKTRRILMHSKTKLNKKQVNQKVGSTYILENINTNFKFKLASEVKNKAIKK